VEKKRATRTLKPNHFKADDVLTSKVESPDTVSTPDRSNTNISARLDRIETLLTSLVSQLGHQNNNNLIHPGIVNHSTNGNATTNTPDALIDSPLQASPDEQNYNGQYFGSHCSFSIFSPKGLTYITNRSKDGNAMDKIVKMLKEVHYVLYQQYKERVEPASPHEIIPLPDRELGEQLIDNFLNTRIYQNGFMDEKEIKERANSYYENLERIPKNRRELRQSEYCILHTVMALGALGTLESNYLMNGNKSKLTPEEIKYYRDLEGKHIISALYYFHRLTVFSDGLSGVRSILLLISYFESSLIPDTEYLLISSIIRFGQSIGLHRKESLLGLTEKESLLKKRIWLNCYVFDKDLCLKSGKPLIINDQDVSSLDLNDMQCFLDSIQETTSLRLMINLKNLDVLNNQTHFKEFMLALSESAFGITRYFEILNLKSARISSRVYFSLFSATALDGRSKRDVMTIVQSLNSAFYELRESVPKFIRPGYKIAIPSLNNNELYRNLIYSHVVKFQLSYHLNVMNVNKIGLNKNWNDGETSANLCLGSAREIIRISQGIKLSDSHLYLCSLFIILSANVTLLSYILENPRDFETIKSDLILMSKTSDLKRLKFIELQYDPVNTMKFLSITFTIKNFIKIGIEFYNQQKSKTNLQGDTSSFEIENNEKDLKILEIELQKCLNQFHHSTEEPVVNPVDESAVSISHAVDTNSNYQMGQYFDQPDFAITQPQVMESSNNYTGSDSTGDIQMLSNNVPNVNSKFPINIDQVMLNDELLDMGYFSQPIFNIPNFLMTDTTP
jgi:hypothetical protein